jgi:hypothetical protein
MASSFDAESQRLAIHAFVAVERDRSSRLLHLPLRVFWGRTAPRYENGHEMP